MNWITEIFNNREIALFIWVVIILGSFFIKKKVRKSAVAVIKALFVKQIILGMIAALIYVSFLIVLLWFVNFWDVSMIKDTIYWILGGAMLMLFQANRALKKDNYFGSILKENLKVILILEFILNLYVFSLVSELILIPVIMFLTLLQVFSDGKEEHKAAKKLFDYLLGVLGLALIIYSGVQIKNDYGNFATWNNLNSFLLPIILSIAYLPFIYFIALYMLYENFFVRVRFGVKKDKKLENYARKKIFKLCKFNFAKLKKLSSEVMWFNASSKKEVKKLLKPFK